ncbi:unnamed protein product [Arabidopsis lyrata]|uniref:Predicted protein n=1 Tax=Arabidopsis lyrata subsp. lyrata TaxID=81972 RepID=D7MVB1_ARALL|nr:predicted protein [Arabidopsis lyrata subsp. lyrata]CAH8276935.1 unnamed protein product [Arabidopsis lyrata]
MERKRFGSMRVSRSRDGEDKSMSMLGQSKTETKKKEERRRREKNGFKLEFCEADSRHTRENQMTSETSLERSCCHEATESDGL